MKLRVQLLVDVYDADTFTDKHGDPRTVIEERVNDAIRWLDGVDVVYSEVTDEAQQSARDTVACRADAR